MRRRAGLGALRGVAAGVGAGVGVVEVVEGVASGVTAGVPVHATTSKLEAAKGDENKRRIELRLKSQ